MRLTERDKMRWLEFLGVAGVVGLLLTVFSCTAEAQEGYSERYLGKQRTYEVRKNWYAEEGGGTRVGDIYDPGTGRLQIRNNHRQILGYIEEDGDVTNTARQILLEIDDE